MAGATQIMKGDVGVESEAGHGCRFWVELLLARADAHAVARGGTADSELDF